MIGSDFDSAETVHVSALAEEWHRRRLPCLHGGIVQGLVPVPEHLLVFLTARIPVHTRGIPGRWSDETRSGSDRASHSLGEETNPIDQACSRDSDGRGGRSPAC